MGIALFWGMNITTDTLTLETLANGKVLEVALHGKLSDLEYKQFEDWIESLIKQHGKVRMLIVLTGFDGWTAKGLWEDIKFDIKHFKDIERLAMVGESKAEEYMAKACKPFTTGDVRYFPIEREGEARQWILEDLDRSA